MTEEKKRTRRPNVVRVALEFTDEEKAAIGNGRKADNAAITKWVAEQLEERRVALLEAHYEAKLAALRSGWPSSVGNT